jgi:YfiR/HmsC-like
MLLVLFLALMELSRGPALLHAQEMDAPAEIQVSLLYKILTFDRKLGDRAPGNDIVIAIVYQNGYRASVVAREQVGSALERLKDSTIAGHPVHWVALELESDAALKAALLRNRVDVIYVAPLRGVEMSHIIGTARESGITTFTGVPRYVEQGLALGIGISRERPQIIVNLPAARAEGSDFNAQLLRVARLVEVP